MFAPLEEKAAHPARHSRLLRDRVLHGASAPSLFLPEMGRHVKNPGAELMEKRRKGMQGNRLMRLALVGWLGFFSPLLVQAETTATAETSQEEKAATSAETPVQVQEFEAIEVIAAPERPPTSSVITQEDLAQGPAKALPGFFEELAGIDLNRSSLSGPKNRQVQIRGLDESRYQVYLDGRTMKGVGVRGGYFVDWSILGLADIERVEVIRGAQSAEYGNTLGGIIKITTAKGSTEPKLHLDSSYGSWDTQNYRLTHAGGYGPFLYNLGGGYSKSSGYLRNNFLDDAYNLSGSLTYNFPWRGSLTLGARYSDLKAGMIVENREHLPFFRPNEPLSDGSILFGPGIPFIGGELTYGDNSYVHSRRFELDLALRQEFWRGEAEGRLFYFQDSRMDRFFALPDRNRLIVQRRVLGEDTWGWNLKTRQHVGRYRFGAGLEGNYLGYGEQRYEFVDPAFVRFIPTGDSGQKNAQKIHGGFVDATIQATSFLELYLGLRYDHYNAAPQNIPEDNIFIPRLRKDALSPKSTLIIRPTASTEAYLSVNWATRFPTQPEFYWYGAGYQPPGRTAALSPEYGLQYEAGITQQLPFNAQLRVRGYYYDINNYIRTVFGFRPSRVIYNIDLVKLRGVEVEVEAGLPYDFRAFANYTWQQSSTSADPLGGDIRELPELPDHKANLGLKYEAPSGAQARFYLRLVSKRSEPQVQVVNNVVQGVTLRPMKGFYTLNFDGRYPVAQWRGFTGYLYGGVENMTGEFYEESAGFPLPTQTLYGGIQLRY
jgi:iron complex outermembrane recepter protein